MLVVWGRYCVGVVAIVYGALFCRGRYFVVAHVGGGSAIVLGRYFVNELLCLGVIASVSYCFGSLLCWRTI